MSTLRAVRLIVILAIVTLVLIIALSIYNGWIGNARSSVISADLAVTRAIAYAKEDNSVGGLVGQATDIRGRVMTYGQAYQTIYGRSLDLNTQWGQKSGNPVWFILLLGNIMEHVPGAPGIPGQPGIPPQDVKHNQMVVIVDGNTGDVIQRVLVSPQKELMVSFYPVLPTPSAPVEQMPTTAPISTVPPLPTLPPVKAQSTTTINPSFAMPTPTLNRLYP